MTDQEIKEWAESHFPVLKKSNDEITYDEMKSYRHVIPRLEGMIAGAKWMREQLKKEENERRTSI